MPPALVVPYSVALLCRFIGELGAGGLMDINDSETLKWRRRTYSGQSAVTVRLQLTASTVVFF